MVWLFASKPTFQYFRSDESANVRFRLINLAITPPGVKYKPSRMPFVQMENISHFLRACQSPPLNLQPHDVFLTVDLYEQKDPAQVLQCIGAFSRAANKVQPSKFPTAIGPKARGGLVSPERTGAVGGGSYGNRQRGISTTSNASSGYDAARSGTVTPQKTAETSGRWSPTKPTRPGMSPTTISTSSWSSKRDEGSTAPAWNIAQYGYMGGASQGNMGVSFGGRRQITSAGPHVPTLAEKEKRRKEQEAEEERTRQLLAEQGRQRQIEEEEEKARLEEEERWAAEERKLRAKAEEEKRKWEEDERRWKQEEEGRSREEKEAEERLAKDRRRSRAGSDARLHGQFLSQYQAEQSRTDRSKSPNPQSSRIAGLERELEQARAREAQYQREREERMKARGHQSLENHDLINRMKEDDRPHSRGSSRKNSQDSWVADEREYLRKEWSRHHQEEAVPPPMPPRTTQPQAAEMPPAMPPRTINYQEEEVAASRPLPVTTPSEPVKLVQDITGPSTRPPPDPATYRSPPKAKYQSPVPALDGATQQSRTDRFLSSHPAPQEQKQKTTYSNELGAFDSGAEQDAEDRRRAASQTKTKAGGWASKSLLEREMEMERQRQREWEEGQKRTAEVAKMGEQKDGVDGIGRGIGGRWDVNQWTGYTGGDSQNNGSQGIGSGRRQIVGPRPPPGR